MTHRIGTRGEWRGARAALLEREHPNREYNLAPVTGVRTGGYEYAEVAA